MKSEVIKQLCGMRHSPLHNYIVPGLTSWMLISNGDLGKVRMFECSREQHEFITPHSHRFDFTACVLRGCVYNTLWVPVDSGGDEYVVTNNTYLGQPGQYDVESRVVARFLSDTICHDEGEWYGMKHNEIHSIRFSKDAIVLFIEGRAVTNTTQVLEPWVRQKRIPTMKVEDWMFEKGQ